MITTWNRAAERIFGWSEAEIIGKPLATLVPAASVGEEQRILSRIRAGKPVERFETVRLAKDGSNVAVLVTVSPILDRSGQVSGASAIARETAELARSKPTSESIAARFRAAFDVAPTPTCLVAPDGSVTDVNRALLDALGYSRQPFLERGLKDIVEATDRELLRESLDRALAGAAPKSASTTITFTGPDVTVAATLSIALIRDDLGQPRQFVCRLAETTAP